MPKWKRSEATGASIEIDIDDEPKISYVSRLITCPNCDNQLEAAKMQLFTPLGFRYVNCRRCATQSWSRGWLCACGVPWHTCEVHRVDPCRHTSRKAPRKCKAKEKEERHFKDSERKAPEAVQSTTRRPLKKVRMSTMTHTYNGVGGSDGQAVKRPHGWKFLEKMRNKWAAKNQEQDGQINPDVSNALMALQPMRCHPDQAVNDHVHQEQSEEIAKRRCLEAATMPGLTRKRLREQLQDQANDRRPKQRREQEPLAKIKPKPKLRIQGHSAITRLLNVGRLSPRGTGCSEKDHNDH